VKPCSQKCPTLALEILSSLLHLHALLTRISRPLCRPEINGTTGTVVEYLPQRERYNIRLGDGEELALKVAALTIQDGEE